MPYILNKTNGARLAVLADATLDLTTDLTFVGRNYAGYGETVNENFVKLLENFSNSTPPPRPIQGQLWFDSSAKRLSLCYDGKNFKSIANLRVQADQPQFSITGDLWWDETYGQLKTYNGFEYKIIGPQESATASWIPGRETTPDLTASVLRGEVEKDVIAVLSKVTFTPSSDSILYKNFSNGVHRGITLAGAVDGSGSTKASGVYLWGTAIEALTASSATSVVVTSTATDASFFVPFTSTSDGAAVLKTDAGLKYNPSTNVLDTIASSARYADLAERYAADAIYEPGTVLIIGGEKEVTTTVIYADTRVAGIVSKNPAYMMNSEAGTDETHPYIALKGRVPCKVSGPIFKGDLLVTSSIPGYAQVWSSRAPEGSVIAKALENNLEGLGVIEVLVV